MDRTFKKLLSNHNRFFDILPQDWQDGIVPFWDSYKNASDIYVIEEDGQTIGGGIVFSTCPPDIQYYKDEAERWIANGYLYLGFIWIAENKRNMNLGTYWLEELKKVNSNQNFWLLTEEDYLHRFYQKNGFVLDKIISNKNRPEWLFVYNSPL